MNKQSSGRSRRRSGWMPGSGLEVEPPRRCIGWQKNRPDDTVAGSSKKLASRCYQLKTSHCLTGLYLQWTKNHPAAQCWWCHCQMQTRKHPSKVCREWRDQQKVLWAEVLKETGRWKSQWKI